MFCPQLQVPPFHFVVFARFQLYILITPCALCHRYWIKRFVLCKQLKMGLVLDSLAQGTLSSFLCSIPWNVLISKTEQARSQLSTTNPSAFGGCLESCYLWLIVLLRRMSQAERVTREQRAAVSVTRALNCFNHYTCGMNTSAFDTTPTFQWKSLTEFKVDISCVTLCPNLAQGIRGCVILYYIKY